MSKDRKPRFDKVVFLGPFQKREMICLDKKYCKTTGDTLVIGDGVKSLKLEDFSLIGLEGQVKEDARIIIVGDGMITEEDVVLRGEIVIPAGKHFLFSDKNRGLSLPTSDIITSLSKTIGSDSKAIIELHSSSGSLSLEELSRILPSGVTLIGIANDIYQSYAYMDRYIKGPKLSSAETKLNLLLNYPADFAYVCNGETLEASPPPLLLSPAKAKLHLINECRRLGIRIEITDQMVAQYNIGLINHHIHSEKPILFNLRKSIRSSRTNLAIDGLDPYIPSPLSLAATRGEVESIKTLISLGADVNKREINGWSALYTAFKLKHMDAFAHLCLIKEVDLNAKFELGGGSLTILYAAASSKAPEDLKALKILCAMKGK